MRKDFRRLVIALICCAALAGGCAGKREDSVSVFAPEREAQYVDADQLTPGEIAAFESTAQIDKNVPDQAKAAIVKEYKKYLRSGRDSMCAMSKQSEQYLAYAREVFKRKGMPEELANLAIVESGYKPGAVSRAGAVGAWQFMPETGRNYGLTQDAWQDDRLDPYKSTEAAAEYLRKLYNDFGDWPTAIAAYNAGEGKLARAKAQAGARDFFEVSEKNHTLDEKTQLKDETKNYVPRFIAVSKIMRNLEDLGFDAIHPEGADPVARFAAKPGTDLKDLSRACRLSYEDLAKLNRHHKRAITCTDRATYVYVPASAKSLASAYLCSDQKANYAGWKFVKVAKGVDSLEKLSKRGGIPLEKLRNANPGIGKLKAGQTILAPSGLRLEPVREVAAKTERTVATVKSGASHVIKKGETLYQIAKKYNVDVKNLMALNSIVNPSGARVGQTLVIPGQAPAQGRSQGQIGKRKTYTVRSQDNLWRIAKTHNVSVEELKAWNQIDEKRLKPGLTLTVSK